MNNVQSDKIDTIQKNIHQNLESKLKDFGISNKIIETLKTSVHSSDNKSSVGWKAYLEPSKIYGNYTLVDTNRLYYEIDIDDICTVFSVQIKDTLDNLTLSTKRI